MGSLGSRILRHTESEIAETHEPEPQAGPSYVSGSRKRRQSRGPSLDQESGNSSTSLDQEDNLQIVSTSHSKKVKITSEHAYQTLFLNAETSDIKIRALGKVWCLHKMFLCQSDYFATMFRGSWKESHEDIIDLDVNDPNIDAESLHFVLGSLYRDEFVLSEPLQVPRVLATAFTLQMEIRDCISKEPKLTN
uniref:BTB domain-containing protein n=1 Tax=Rhinolophus ferrumequinum TaxID=59479 RepID=A0A671DL86_RHIFE